MLFITSPLVLMAMCCSLGEAKFYGAHHFNQYKAGMVPHHEQGKPTSRHKNHCAYVVEKTVSFTVQDRAAPYVKAEYNKCSWGQKCPTLLYRLMYKPLFKVAHKTVTELEWRCCPGYSGYGCMEGPPQYQAPMRMMPPFKGPQFKGPTFKGPTFKGPPTNPMVKANPWSQPKGPPTGGFGPYPMRHFGPPSSSSYPEAPFQPYPSSPEPLPEPELEPGPEHVGVHHEEHEPEHGHHHGQGPGEHIQEESLPASVEQAGVETLERTLDSEREERIFRMEEEVQRLNQGLETLRGTVNGLEDSLRASLREDANRMLSALLSAAPGPAPAPVVASNPSTVGFVEIPGEEPKTEGLDGTHLFPTLGELNGRVEELRKELQAKALELQDLKAAVLEHDGELKKMSEAADDAEGRNHTAAETMLDGKLSAARTEILSGLEKRVESAETHCEERAGDVSRQYRREQSQGQGQLEEALDESTSDLRAELRDLQAQLHALKSSGSCCDPVGGLGERVKLLEASVAGLNQSQGHLRVELGGHKDHIEGMIAGRLEYVEAKLNVTRQPRASSTALRGAMVDGVEAGRGLEARMESKLRALEGRLLVALEELGNATAPALLEGHAVPTLETELESLRGRLEMDVDRVKKHLSSLEVLCTSSCSPPQAPTAIQADSAPDARGDRLDNLNATLQDVARRLSQREQQSEVDPPVQGQLTILKFSVRSVNRTLRALQDSLGAVVHQVGETNSSWHEREARLAQQMKGVVQLVGHQASMLGAGERRLTRLKGELQDMRRRLAQEVQGCRSTAMGVQKEVSEVGGRVASVEDQCKGLNILTEDLERIRDELEKQSNGLLLQVNGTLSNHSQQLSELRDEVRNCTTKAEPEPRRGDTFSLH